MSHLDEGTLHGLLDGEIPSAELAPIQRHLAGCAECRARLEAERELLGAAEELVGAIEVPERPESPLRSPARGWTRRAWTRNLAWAASVLGAVGLGYAARGMRPASESASRAVSPVAAPEFRAVAPDTTPAAEAPKPNPPPLPTTRPERRPGAPDRTRATDAPAARDARSDAAAPAAANLAAAAKPETIRVAQEAGRAAPMAFGAAAPPGPAAKLVAADAPEGVSFPEALRRLNGSLRLIPGLVPLRLESWGSTIRVIYPVAQGELILSQQLRDGRLEFSLTGPPGFPVDSLARLRNRVRD